MLHLFLWAQKIQCRAKNNVCKYIPLVCRLRKESFKQVCKFDVQHTRWVKNDHKQKIITQKIAAFLVVVKNE